MVNKLSIVLFVTLVIIIDTKWVEGRNAKSENLEESLEYSAVNCRAHSASITDFGGVGDGITSNTQAFHAAVDHLSQFQSDGGALLFVPSGKWLTGSFNLTSHFTLFLHKDAVLLASQDIDEWPIIDPLPSYGRGRDAPGGRYVSLIFGTNLTDVIITGDNGTINGQGELWWQKFHKGQLKHTRPYLIELIYSDTVQISDLTLVDSPSWNVHPVYSSNIIVQGLTISAPLNSPNTDGINPDSCTNIRIVDCYIMSGDDCIAVKSGWDEYGISFGMPTKQLLVRRLTCISPTSAVIALGSEMSGGIQDVRAEDIVAINSESGVRIKTGPGRGGFVKDIYVERMTLHTMKWVFWITGNYGSHPDDHFNPNALPTIKNINYRNVVAEDVKMAARLEGIPGDTFTEICLSNVTISLDAKPKKVQWTCSDIDGISSAVTPKPCDQLADQGQDRLMQCKFPTDPLAIDEIQMQKCSYKKQYL